MLAFVAVTSMALPNRAILTPPEVGIGGILEQFPSMPSPDTLTSSEAAPRYDGNVALVLGSPYECQPHTLKAVAAEPTEQLKNEAPPRAYSDNRKDGRVVECTGLLNQHGSQSVEGSNPSLSANLPTDFPGLTLPTHVDHDGAVVAAAGERVRALGGSLTESEAISVLRAAGWPTELIPAALKVAWCESKYSAATGDGGNSVGWFQLGKSRPGWQGWFLYFGVDESLAYDFETNARVAWLVYQYEQARGYRPFANWSCRP